MGVDLFGEVVRRADLKSIEPIEMSAKRGAYKPPCDEEITLESRWSHSMNDERTTLVVYYSHRVVQAPDGADEPADLDCFQAAIDFQLVYEFSPALTEEHEDSIAQFAEHNGRFNSWPYLRSYLSRVTSEFGFSPLLLPLLKPFAPRRKVAESADA